MSSSEPKFTVVDKRGQNQGTVLIEAPKPPESEEVKKGKRTWKSQGFMHVLSATPIGTVPAGRIAGLRGDGPLFVADFLFAPVTTEHEDWRKEARRRLNTFLGCECKTGHRCNVHQVACENWIKEDIDRIMKSTQKDLPEAIEVLMKAEQARQKTSLVVPR